MTKTIRYVDLFSGIGGFRLGFEQALKQAGLKGQCVLSADIKKPALEVYSKNFEPVMPVDLTQIVAEEIPDFDVLLGGFPCQAFSSAGKRDGFVDTRGTLFFDVERILKAKRPAFFILENVEGLVNHDKDLPSEKIGRTLNTILKHLAQLGYKVSWKVLNSADFGLAQNRKRIFIVGSLKHHIRIDNFPKHKVLLKQVLEQGLEGIDSNTAKSLLERYKPEELYGKSIKDKRGGKDNIHSWDLELKGKITDDQRDLLEKILRSRRNKKWGTQKGIAWMDGMPLTFAEIKTFCPQKNLRANLDDLVNKGYLTLEHPKDLTEVKTELGIKKIRTYRKDLEKGYNIVAGKLSFEISKILDPGHVAPTLVATDLDKIAVVDNGKLRKLSQIELKRLFGFPDDFILEGKNSEIYDLFGNSVPVNIVQKISERILRVEFKDESNSEFFVHENVEIEQMYFDLFSNQPV